MTQQISIVVYAKQGCSYCADVKTYLTENNYEYKIVDITNFDQYRDVFELKYGIRHVPVVEIGTNNTYTAVTEVGVSYLQEALKEAEAATV
jgi:glutaredoxin